MRIGVKVVPITTRISRGPISTMVHITYVREAHRPVGECEIWNAWINPVVDRQLDLVDRTHIVSLASTRLGSALQIQVRRNPDTDREWEGVCYG